MKNRSKNGSVRRPHGKPSGKGGEYLSMKNMAEGNDWLWNSRWARWWFKRLPAEAGCPGIPAEPVCMHPMYSGILGAEEISRSVEEFKRCGINAVLTEGVRRLVLFEQQGRTPDVNEGIRIITKALHEAGIRVLHHVTTVLAGHSLDEIPASRRDWLNIDAATGEYAFLECWGGWYLWCVNNPEFRGEYFRLCREVMRTAGTDGLMADEVYFRTGWHNCACKFCREKFLRATGRVLPGGGDGAFWGNFENPAFRAWIAFRTASVGDFYRDLRAEIEKEHPRPVLMGCKNKEPNPVCSRQFGENNEERMRGTNVLFIETGRDALLYSWRRLSFEYMAYGGLSNYYGTPTVATMYRMNPDEMFLGWALRSSHGVRVWAASRRWGTDRPGEQFLNSPEDMRLFEKLFSWEKNHEKQLSGMIKPAAGIGVLLSAATRDMAPGVEGGADGVSADGYYVKELIGWCQMLADEYLQYSVIVQEQLEESELGRYSLVILPNAACMSGSACEAVLNYLSAGGSLIFTGDAGLYDETGASRGGAGPLAEGLGVSRGSGGGSFPAAFQEGASGLGRWAYFPLPPGRACYSGLNSCGRPRTRKTGAPEVPQEIADMQKSIMAGAVKKLAGAQPVVVKKAPPGLLIKAYRRHSGEDNETVVHILNLRGESVGFGGIIPEDYAVEYPRQDEDIEIEFRSRLPERARLVTPDAPGEQRVEISREGGMARVRIPAGTLFRYSALLLE